jgi:hypothetical protein
MPDVRYLTGIWVLPAALVAYLFFALYGYAPFKIRRSQKKGVSVEFVPIDLAALPPNVLQAFQDATPALDSCGFRVLGTLSKHPADNRQQAFVSIWTSQSTGDSAQIIGISTLSAASGLKTVTLVTFRAEYSDGTSIVTTNSPSSSCFPADDRVNSVRCPGIWDVSLLYRFHRARVERHRAGRTAILERIKDPYVRMQLEHTETYERLVRAGYYVLDPMREYYVPTLKGAFLMTYRLLPPFKQIQKTRKDRRADRALRESGFGGMTAFGNMARTPG